MSRQQLYQEQYAAAYGFLRQNLFLAGKNAQVGAWFGETRKIGSCQGEKDGSLGHQTGERATRFRRLMDKATRS